MSYSTEINQLVSEGSKLYASKDYELASEKYGKACEEYSNEHEGEEDGDLLFLYGKALYQNGVSKSEVLGGVRGANGQDGDEEKQDGEGEEDAEGEDKFQFYDAEPIEGEIEGEGAEPAEGEKNGETSADGTTEDGSEDEQDQEGDEEGQEPGDLEMAWMILDATRAVFEKQIESATKPTQSPPYISNETALIEDEYVKLLKKLSETYDILGEVSLEMENFPQSAQDLNKSLDLRLELYPSDSPLVSESHYKLALALEFCVEDEGDDAGESRKKAAQHIKSAIKSTEARNKKETDETKRKDNEQMIGELKEKYQDLIKDPNEQLQQDQLDIMKGILGSDAAGANAGQAIINNLTSIVKKKGAEGSSSSSKSATTTSAPKVVNDLSGLVKKRKQNSDPNASKKARK